MATFKTTSSDYTINVGPYSSSTWNGTMTVNGNFTAARNVSVAGNLAVAGNVTYVSDIAVNDAFIVVAANNTGTVTDMGLVATINANTGKYAGLRFDTTANTWQISSSVDFNGTGTYSNIFTGNGTAFVAGTNTQVQFNDSGNFGATGNLTFNKSTNKLTVASGDLTLGYITSTPPVVSNSVILCSNVAGAGRTGLYVAPYDAPRDELVSYRKAKLLSIIL